MEINVRLEIFVGESQPHELSSQAFYIFDSNIYFAHERFFTHSCVLATTSGATYIL